jgi:hypothetical protein
MVGTIACRVTSCGLMTPADDATRGGADASPAESAEEASVSSSNDTDAPRDDDEAALWEASQDPDWRP